MPASLTVTDDANGLSATASVGGVDAGTPVTTFARPAAAAAGSPWQPAGTRVGPGAVSLPLGLGGWWAYAAGTAGGLPAVSPPAQFAVSPSGFDSRHYRCLEATRQAIAGLSLPLIGGAVYVQEFPDEKPGRLPCVFVTPTDTDDIKRSHTCHRDDRLPVVVDVCDRTDSSYQDKLRLHLHWRERVKDLLLTPRLWLYPAVPGVKTTELVMRAVVDPELPKYQFLSQAMVLYCTVEAPKPQ